MGEISRVVKSTVRLSDGCERYWYKVYYKETTTIGGQVCRWDGQVRTYGEEKNLPVTVVKFMLDAESCETRYVENGKIETWAHRPVAVEFDFYTKAGMLLYRTEHRIPDMEEYIRVSGIIHADAFKQYRRVIWKY